MYFFFLYKGLNTLFLFMAFDATTTVIMELLEPGLF